jgi:hypothetical protein
MSTLREKGQWWVRVTRDVYKGVDIDRYRLRYGKEEGERRFYQDVASGPDDRLQQDGNLLLLGGISLIFECLIGNGTSTSGQSLTFLANSTTWIGVGDSSTATTSTMTDLQAGTNYYSNAADSTYPAHTAGSTGKTITGATNASPIAITATSHGYSTNDIVNINGVGGNTNANGTFQITVSDSNTFTLNGSSGNAAYTSGGIASKNNVLVVKSTFGTSVANFAWNEWVIRNNGTKGSGSCLNRAVVSLGTKTSSASWALTVAPYLN